ncbi:MAG: hypothetical protein C4319_00065 [Acidimicrobiia bacterium]
MIKRFIERIVGKTDTPPEPLRPGEAVEGTFEVKLRENGHRYNMAKALQRTYEVQEARRKLGLDEEEELRLPEDYLLGPVPKSVQQSMLERDRYLDTQRR